MDNQSRREEALKLLASTGIWRSNYHPPYLILLWKLGIDARPPHFNKFWHNVRDVGIPFGLFWGVWMWFSTWRESGMPLWGGMLAAGSAAFLFGFWMALIYERGKRKHHLPPWEDIKES